MATEILNKIRDREDPTNWCVLVGDKDAPEGFSAIDSGVSENPIESLKGYFTPEFLGCGYISIAPIAESQNRRVTCFFVFFGDKSPMGAKARFRAVREQIEEACYPAQVSIEASEHDHMHEADVIHKARRSMGANYGGGAGKGAGALPRVDKRLVHEPEPEPVKEEVVEEVIEEPEPEVVEEPEPEEEIIEEPEPEEEVVEEPEPEEEVIEEPEPVEEEPEPEEEVVEEPEPKEEEPVVVAPEEVVAATKEELEELGDGVFIKDKNTFMEYIDKVKAENDPTDVVVVQYFTKPKSHFVIAYCGTGGLEKAKEYLDEGKNFCILLALGNRYCSIEWIATTCPISHIAKFGHSRPIVLEAFGYVHIPMETTDLSMVTSKEINERLRRFRGANYGGGKSQ
ncbi:hypothetical protein PCE1_001310 [Barthelona sp. PCE]